MKKNSEINQVKTCKKCQMKNQISSRFCKQCGSALSVSSLQDKKAKVLAGKKRKSNKTLVSYAALAIFLCVAGFWIIKGRSVGNPGIANQPKISQSMRYSNQSIGMTGIEAVVENGKISIPIDVVQEKKIVRFEYESDGVMVPLLAYVTPSGKAVTAVSMCEPCRSTRFHIRKDLMVCNSCDTEWNLETLRGISGGCLMYPPDLIPSEIGDGRIWIEEKVVRQWKPRI